MFPVQLPHVGAEGDAPLFFGSIVMLKAPYFEDDSTARVAEGRRPLPETVLRALARCGVTLKRKRYHAAAERRFALVEERALS
jgi:hypothetical protein